MNYGLNLYLVCRAVNLVGMKKGRFVWPKTFTGMQWGDKFFGPLRGV